MNILGVIPAAGEGSRWGGYYKELLPIGNRGWMLDRIITCMNNAQNILIVSSKNKINAHVQHLESHGFTNILYTIQRRTDLDIFGAIYESLKIPGDYNLFAMPDTYIPENTFQHHFDKDFHVGVFKTTTPERFGVLSSDRTFVNKQNLSGGQYLAWGTLVWSKRVAEFWRELKPLPDYTEAINLAIQEFGLNTFLMDYYYDLATWADYVEFIDRIET
jgi:dTDP-glucose pyrophosphorylase